MNAKGKIKKPLIDKKKNLSTDTHDVSGKIVKRMTTVFVNTNNDSEVLKQTKEAAAYLKQSMAVKIILLGQLTTLSLFANPINVRQALKKNKENS